jgi:hypothetical protein
VRRCLATIRKIAKASSDKRPLCITDMLTPAYSMEQIALQYLMGNYTKRVQKFRRINQRRSESASTTQDSRKADDGDASDGEEMEQGEEEEGDSIVSEGDEDE